MKEIVIRRLQLLNFKGIRSLTIDFDEHETNIYGANAVGKTTIFDAFVWLLFGKDSNDRKDFNIKTLGKNGQAIPRLPHEVTGWIEVNGQEIVLKKCYSEVWSKKRGSAVETFQGHQVECYFNEVPCAVKEYDAKVAEICDAQVFKLITNPAYFTSQKKDFQRAMLFRLAGEVSTSDILAANPEFEELVNMLSGKTLDELKREVACKKRKIKEGIDSTPARIDEVKRNLPEEQDWTKLESEIAADEGHIKRLESLIEDRSKLFNEQTKKKQEIARALSGVQSRIADRESVVTGKLMAEYIDAKRRHENALSDAQRLRNERHYLSISLPRLESELGKLKEKRDGLLAEWRSIKAEIFTEPSIDSFVCPTCHRPLDTEHAEAEIEKLRNAFNEHRASALARNKQVGIETKALIDAKTAEIERIKTEIFNKDVEISELEGSTEYTYEPQAPDTKSILTADETYLSLVEEAMKLRAALSAEIEAPDTSDLKEEIRQIRERIRSSQRTLDDRTRIAAGNKRISELESEYQESQAELARLEGLEFTILQFSKARIDQIESRINGLFDIVKFKMFEQQLNGGEVETCEATVDGVPFSDLNTAQRVNAGLDIINAICTSEGIIAPIFIDNRESVSDIIDTKAQIINLVVSPECKRLKIG